MGEKKDSFTRFNRGGREELREESFGGRYVKCQSAGNYQPFLGYAPASSGGGGKMCMAGANGGRRMANGGKVKGLGVEVEGKDGRERGVDWWTKGHGDQRQKNAGGLWPQKLQGRGPRVGRPRSQGARVWYRGNGEPSP